MRRPGGFSLVELMVTVAIMGMLLAIGLPAIGTYMDNLRVRTTAESLLTAVELAKTNAASRNTRVEIIFTNATDVADLATAEGSASAPPAFPDGAPTGWMIRTANRATYIEGKSALEGARTRAGASTITVVRTVTGITFTPLGGTTLAARETISIRDRTAGDCYNPGPPESGTIRCLNVVVSPAGRIKLCDPTVTAAGDTRACPI